MCVNCQGRAAAAVIHSVIDAVVFNLLLIIDSYVTYIKIEKLA
jgi:hypothetical protein